MHVSPEELSRVPRTICSLAEERSTEFHVQSIAHVEVPLEIARRRERVPLHHLPATLASGAKERRSHPPLGSYELLLLLPPNRVLFDLRELWRGWLEHRDMAGWKRRHAREALRERAWPIDAPRTRAPVSARRFAENRLELKRDRSCRRSA
eukprot:2930989-Prymnesium_polylepis.1